MKTGMLYKEREGIGAGKGERVWLSTLGFTFGWDRSVM